MEIQKILPGAKKDVLLKNYATFKIGGKARYLFIVRTKEELANAVWAAKETKLSFFILGGGSNLLVSDNGFSGLVIKMENCESGIEDSKIIGGAGLSLSKLVAETARNGLGGAEWASGIPGTLGGAVRGNAGAFGLAMQDIVESVEALDAKNLKFRIYDQKKCRFGYRESVFKKNKNLIIFSATLKFKKESKEKISREIKEYLGYRRKRHPKDPSAGSVFKNVGFSQRLAKKFPELSQFEEKGSVPAAFLISECGLKGKIAGGAKISDQHPNFILNFKEAKAKDVRKLINLAKKEVKEKFSLVLEEEIEYLGF